MAGRVRNLVNRNGRYYARLVVPERLRRYVGKTELRAPLGADRRTALAHHPGAIAELQRQLAIAEQRRQQDTDEAPKGRYPMTAPQIARQAFDSLADFDLEARRTDPRWTATADPDPDDARLYRDGYSGKLTDDELDDLVGHRIERYRFRGNTDATKGTPQWRELAMALCASTYEFMALQHERNAGNFDSSPAHPLLQAQEPTGDPLPIGDVFDAYIRELKAAGKGVEMERAGRPVLDRLKAFLGHDNARRLTKADLLAYKDEALKTLSARTVKHTHLAILAAALQHAVDNGRLDVNPARGIKVRIAPKPKNRPQGFTDKEAFKILAAARDYQPKHYDNPRHHEAAETVAAKRWAPWLSTFTGARIGEICQLRKEDVRQEGGIWLIRISPEAGTVKTRQYRDVPLHNQLIKLGFLDFVEAAPDGHLFFPTNRKRAAGVLPGRR